MLELLDLDKKVTKPVYSARMEKLQASLRGLQYAAQQAQIPVAVCIEGWSACGRDEVVKKLSEKLDPRLCRFRTFVAPSSLERRYHFLWRYQMALPNDGEMTVYDHSWYSRVLVERCERLTKKKAWRAAFEQMNEFERWLTDDGQVILKFWLHISKAEQRRRFRAYKNDPVRRARLTKEYRRQHRQYPRWLKAVEEMLQKTGTAHAPWTVVEAHDLRWARIRVFETIIKSIEDALKHRRAHPEAVSRSAAAVAASRATASEDTVFKPAVSKPVVVSKASVRKSTVPAVSRELPKKTQRPKSAAPSAQRKKRSRRLGVGGAAAGGLLESSKSPVADTQRHDEPTPPPAEVTVA
ncbi:MAG: hypothetical protein GZ088_14045 [Acidipila sp.]|nr:hypothetical protein [Acidipila sp.]